MCCRWFSFFLKRCRLLKMFTLRPTDPSWLSSRRPVKPVEPIVASKRELDVVVENPIFGSDAWKFIAQFVFFKCTIMKYSTTSTLTSDHKVFNYCKKGYESVWTSMAWCVEGFFLKPELDFQQISKHFQWIDLFMVGSSRVWEVQGRAGGPNGWL